MRTLIGNISYLLFGRDILGPEPIWRSASTGAKSILMPLVRLALKTIPYLDFEVKQILIRSDLHDTTYEDNKKGHDPMPSIPLQKPLEKVLGHAHGMASYYGCPAPPPPPPYRPQPPPVYRPRLRIIFSNRRRTAALYFRKPATSLDMDTKSGRLLQRSNNTPTSLRYVVLHRAMV